MFLIPKSGAAGLSEELLTKPLQDSFFQTGDIGLGDSHFLGHLLLGQLLLPDFTLVADEAALSLVKDLL